MFEKRCFLRNKLINILSISLGIIGIVLVIYGFYMHFQSTNPTATSKYGLTNDEIAYLEQQYGINKPWHEEFIVDIQNILSGDFGYSINQ